MKTTSLLCYYCDQPATTSHELQLTPTHDLAFIEYLIATSKGNEPPQKRSAVTVTAHTCDIHEDAFLEACHDTYGDYPSGRRIEPENSCPDPWHTDPESYEIGKGKPQRIGDGHLAQGYKCPTCGFETLTQKIIPNSIVETGAYKYAIRAFEGTR